MCEVIEEANLLLKRRLIYIVILLSYFTVVYSQINTFSSEAFGDRLRIGLIGKPPLYFDPYRIDDVESLQINRLIYGPGLIQLPDRFGNSPQLVDKYVVPVGNNAKDLDWKFILKRNIIFQNGLPLRNSDVLFTFRMLKKWGGHILNRKINFSNVKYIRVNGDLEVQFILKRKDPNFLWKLTDIPILSQSRYQSIKKYGFEYLKEVVPMGCGPFRYQHSNDHEVSLIYHPHYAFGRPFLNGVSFIFFENEQELIDNFIRGNIDLIEIKDKNTAQRLNQVLRKEITIFATPRPERKVYFIQFNLNRFPFKNPQDRIAIRRSINKEEIVEKLNPQNGGVAYSIVHQDHPYFYEKLKKEKYHPGLSLKMLSENGWKMDRTRGILVKKNKQFNFELIFEQNSQLEESLARLIKIHLAEIGINVHPKPVDRNTKKMLISTNNYTAIINSYSYFEENLFEGIQVFYEKVLKNADAQTNYQSLALERLLKIGATTPDPAKQLIQRLQIILNQDTPVVFLFFDEKIIYAVHNRFKEIRVTFMDGESFYHRLNPFENWFVPKPLQKFPNP